LATSKFKKREDVQCMLNTRCVFRHTYNINTKKKTHVDTRTYRVDIPAKHPTEHNAPARTYIAQQTVCEDILYEMLGLLRGRVAAGCNVCV
jgi:hypothetical protein